MSTTAVPPKGAVLEEVLRAYFLRAGFFVVRGVPFRIADEDLTDVDLWLYERPTGTARRVQICDIKYKQRPKAIERIFWTAGLADVLEVDGAYVATTDKRKSLRAVAERVDLQLIDGADIQRIQGSQSVLYADRISDEDLIGELQAVDKAARNKHLQEARLDVLSSLSEGFGGASTVRALEGFGRLAHAVTSYHPDSQAARAAARLAYLAAAITCESLDFVSVGAAFRGPDERRELMLKAVRLGALADDRGEQSMLMAVALVEKYAPGGRATAASMQAGLKRELESIPAEIVADQAARLLKADQLFLTGREFEMAAYRTHLPPFDQLAAPSKAMLGALLDYSGVDRVRFATAWQSESQPAHGEMHEVMEKGLEEASPQQSLFKNE